MEWPEWWSRGLEFTPHLLKRMEDRDFTEIDVTLEEINGVLDRVGAMHLGPEDIAPLRAA